MQLKKLCSTIHLQQSGSNENFTAAWIIHSNQGILEKAASYTIHLLCSDVVSKI